MINSAISKRRSIRKYKAADIPEKDVEMMLEAAMMAPSARNSRPWEFVVIRDPLIKRKIAENHPYCRANAANVLIAVCGIPSKSEFWQQDCGAAIENILLQVTELGHGACWCGVYPNQERTDAITRLLKVESVPVAVITIGVPDESPDAKGRYEAEKVKHL